MAPDGVESQRLHDDVQLWIASLDAGATGLDDDVSQLSAEEAARAAQLRFDRDRRHYVASHIWLRRLLADRLGLSTGRIAYRYGAAGKPELVSAGPSELRFSMSRSGGRALYALACGRDVGVDIERCSVQADLATVESRFFAPAERAELKGLDADRRQRAFYRLWTRKEAYVKAVGVGLRFPLDAIDITGDLVKLDAAVPELTNRRQPWSVRDLDVEHGYAAAVSIEGDLDAAQLRVRLLDREPSS
jgi:4'-phosphopantetheinyl transferase